jgi:osmoprotectant transport system permease protein
MVLQAMRRLQRRASAVNVRAVIELDDVRKIYRDASGRERVAVDGVTLSVEAGETLCLLGTSGCGKTTTLRMINRLVEPSSGTVRVGGDDVRARDVIALRRGIGYVIQNGGLLPHLTVAENVGLLCRLERWPAEKRGARVAELLELVGLGDAGERVPRELSGGQRQRVGVARALALDPPILLMDEPFGALDPVTRGELRGELAAMWRRLGKTVLVVTHDVDEAFELGDSVALMNAGRVEQRGTKAEFRDAPASGFVRAFVKKSAAFVAALCLALCAWGGEARADEVVVASKAFTESRVLGEMAAQIVEARTGLVVKRREGLGGTEIVYRALEGGAVDLYPEYTGTAWAVLLGHREPLRDRLAAWLAVERELAARGIAWVAPLGFDDSYALAVAGPVARRLGLVRVSDLAAHKELRAGLSHEFLAREDGWPGVTRVYGLELAAVRGMEHGLAYQALASGSVDVVDTYTTDGKLLDYDVVLLEDDRHFFPPYDAGWAVRAETARRHPEIVAALHALSFRLDAAKMRALNHEAEAGGGNFAAVARGFLEREGLIGSTGAGASASSRAERVGLGAYLWRERRAIAVRAGQHVLLTLGAVLAAIVVAVPLGVALTRRRRLAMGVLSAAAVVQTVPALALLALLVPVMGLGARAAITALFLYALLPILLASHAGVRSVDADLVDAARGIGLTDRQVLWYVELPLATRAILAGVRTAAVVSVGFATLAAFVGAGGLGEPIVTGLQLDDLQLVLSGAIPAALLAVVADFGLGRLERRLVPRGLEPLAEEA